MCNSGSSALYLAVELLGLAAGRRDHHVGGHVLHRHRADRARRPRAGVRRRRARHLQRRRRRDRGDDRPAHARRSSSRTSSATCPTGTASARSPTRTACRSIEDSCDALGSTLRGTPTGTRSDISVTSFALSHIITAAGTGGMVCLDDDDARRPLPAPAPLGPPVGDADLRIAQGRRPPLLLVDRRRHRIRQPLHLRRGRLELRTVGAVRRVRARATREARRQPRGAASTTSRGLTRAVRAAARRVRAPAHDARRRHRLAHVPGAHPARVRRAARRVPGSTWSATASTPGWCGPATRCASPRSRASRTARRRRPAERRSRDGTGADPAVEPQPRATTTSTTSGRPRKRSCRRPSTSPAAAASAAAT